MAKKNGASPAVEELSSVQLQAIGMITAGRTQTETAEALEIVPETITRWKQQPLFLAELNRRKVELYDAASNALDNLTMQALTVLGEVLNDGNTTSRLAAAKAILALRSGPPSLPTDPEAIQKQTARDAMFDEILGW